MKKILCLILSVLLTFSFSVVSFAVTADEQADKLTTGWGSGTTLTYPSGYSTSWFYRVLYWLDSINDNATSISNSLKVGGTVYDFLLDIKTNTGGTGVLYSLLNNKLSDLIEAVEVSTDLSNIESSLGEKTTDNNSIIWCLNQINARLANTTGEFYKLDQEGSTEATSDYFYSSGSNLFDMTYDIRKFKEYYLDKSDFEYAYWSGLGKTSQSSSNLADSINNNLFTIANRLAFKYTFTRQDYLAGNGTPEEIITIYNSGALAAIPGALAHIHNLLSRLTYVIADDDEIAFHQSMTDSKSNVLDLATTGVTSSSGSSLSMISGISDGIGVVTDFNDKFTSSDVSVADVFKIFDDTSESLSWFTEETASNIDSVSSTFTRNINPQTEVVTSYYDENKSKFSKMWGDIVG